MIHRYIENSAQSPRDRDSASSTEYNTPQHYNFFPIGAANISALLVIIQHGESESSGCDNEAFLISTSPGLDATERSIATGILEHYPLPFPFPTAQATRSMFHPTIVAMPHQSHCEAWRSGDRIINYFIHILQSAAQFGETFRSPTQGREQLRTWDEKGIDPVRPMIATAVLYHFF
ncbi:hypothetical protein FIBSPDRAFT_970791 [Athelia psychrophila]|uniref:Uncharacterized protein n=1 Tax=Athelia psychrophila TaxID=1759441 RepID=A0A167SIB4_9AGAM|nr:hypothetical protein FIBSPDRAFT_970791 [Fibularhizoctonia sp. CBS 109695]